MLRPTLSWRVCCADCRGKADAYMDEIPTILVDPLPDDIKMVRLGAGAAPRGHCVITLP